MCELSRYLINVERQIKYLNIFGVFPKLSINFTEFSEFRENDNQ